MSKSYTITITDKQAKMLEKVSAAKHMSEQDLIEYYLTMAIPDKANKRTIITQINSGLFQDFNIVAKLNGTSFFGLLKTVMMEEVHKEGGEVEM